MTDRTNGKKTRGAWMVTVKGASTGQGADAGHGRCSPAPGGDIPHHSEQENAKDEKEED